MSKKVVIDCDVGVDDALALILAFHSPELEVKAVTGVNGNVPLQQVFENIQKVLSLIQPQDKPLIAKGADRPLKGKTIYAHSVHGRDGLGGANIERNDGERFWQIYSGLADQLIQEMARQYPDELTLIATGPLTNLALALQRDPEGMRKLNEVILMGGAVRTKGNITHLAEFNLYSDPIAAKLVFESGLPITVVPLDVTHQVSLTSPLIEEQVKPIQNRFSRFLIEAIGYDFTTHRFREKERIYLHDPLAVGVAIQPDLVRKERTSLDVIVQEGECYGQIREVEEGPKIEVCFGVEASRFLDLFFARLK
ncbi:MAG: nucleoside hydrolase [Syntrophaceae bacterium]|nr:nucleoside hydrolase [Syntrophaceae bacterium]